MALEPPPTYQDSKEEAGSAYESSYERAKTELNAAKTELEALRKAALDIRFAATLIDSSLLPSTMTTAPTFDADKVAEEMERLLGMEQAQFSPGATPWLIGGLGAGYAPPTSSEVLPNMLLSSEAQAFVKEHKDLYTTFNVSEFPQVQVESRQARLALPSLRCNHSAESRQARLAPSFDPSPAPRSTVSGSRSAAGAPTGRSSTSRAMQPGRHLRRCPSSLSGTKATTRRRRTRRARRWSRGWPSRAQTCGCPGSAVDARGR